MNLPNHDDEGRVITLEFPDFYILSCYTPNSGEGLRRLDYRTKEWDVEFQDFVDKLKAKKNVIVCGDLNVAHQEIDIHKAKGHENSAGFTQEERESFTKFLDRGYVDTFRYLHPETVKFSYFSKYHKQNKSLNKGWRLDYFIVNKEAIEHVTEADIMTEYDSSDHCPIIIQWKI